MNNKLLIAFISVIVIGLVVSAIYLSSKNADTLSIFTPNGNGIFTPTVTLDEVNFNASNSMKPRIQVYFQSGTWDGAISFGKAYYYFDNLKYGEVTNWEGADFGNGNNREYMIYDSTIPIVIPQLTAGKIHKFCVKTYSTPIDDYDRTTYETTRDNFYSCPDASNCQYTHLDGEDCVSFYINPTGKLSLWDSFKAWLSSVFVNLRWV